MPKNGPPTSTNAEQKLSDSIQKRIVSRSKNFFIEQEIFQRQGFNGAISHENIAQMTKNLVEGFDYLKQNAQTLDADFLAEEASYTSLKQSKLGIAPEEACLFDLVTRYLTIQHASEIQLAYDTSLKSIRQREIEGEPVELKYTSNAMGRQNFVYFVTGIGNHVNVPGLHDLNIYSINLKKLASHNPQKFSQIHVSPHLTEFETNASASPFFVGNTKIDIQFDGERQTITYCFQRSAHCFLKRTYHLHDFVFYGGNDVIKGIALRFIELLRFVGNPYREALLKRLKDTKLSKKEKLVQLSQLMTMLMPGSKVIEAKIPKEIDLQESYAKIIIPETKPSNSLNVSSVEEKTDTPCNPFIEYLKKYAHEFYEHAGISCPIEKDRLEEDFASVLDNILKETSLTDFSGHLPFDLNLLARQSMLSWDALSLPLIKWLLSAKFVSEKDPGLCFLLNLNERESLGTQDLLFTLLSVDFQEKKVEALLEIIFPLLNESRVQLNFCNYVATAAKNSFDGISNSKIIRFLLEKNISIKEGDPDLLEWITFENNELLLEYMFVKQSLNINAIVHQCSWLEHAILNQNRNAVQWMLAHGAVLHRANSSILKLMQQLGFHPKPNQNTRPCNGALKREAVVVMVTATYPDGELYTVMGRRRVHNKLEDRWSFPGGLLDSDETPVEAAIRELAEETCIKIDVNSVRIRELFKVKLHNKHSRLENNLGHLHFLHIHLGDRYLPSIWPGDDLGEVTTIKVHDAKAEPFLKMHKNLSIRVSNLELFDYLKGNALSLAPEQVSLLIFAEMYPLEFVSYHLELMGYIERRLANQDPWTNPGYEEVEHIKNDRSALSLLKETSLDIIQDHLQKISHTIQDANMKRAILLSVNSVSLRLFSFLIENGYSLDHLYKDDTCNLYRLINNQQWPLLQFICEKAPYLLHVRDNWEAIVSKLPSIPDDSVRQVIYAMNADNYILDQLKYLFEKRKDISAAQRETSLEFIKNVLKQYPEAMDRFEEEHVNFILLSGDLTLYERCSQQPHLAKLFFKLKDTCIVRLPNFNRVDLFQYLSDNGHTEMLALLHEKFPETFSDSAPQRCMAYTS